jgi:hypothetical protein
MAAVDDKLRDWLVARLRFARAPTARFLLWAAEGWR